jgi:hypothetical protein
MKELLIISNGVSVVKKSCWEWFNMWSNQVGARFHNELMLMLP